MFILLAAFCLIETSEGSEYTLQEPEGNWEYIDVRIEGEPGQIMRIHYLPNNNQRQRAEWIKEAYLKAHPIFKNLLGLNLIAPVYTYLTTDIHLDAHGLFICDFFEIFVMGYIVKIRSDYLEDIQKKTQSVFAHELFHCFQDTLLFSNRDEDTEWVEEATAVWAENRVYPDYNIEHEYLGSFFIGLWENLTFQDEEAYPWFLFLTQKAGNDLPVKKVLYDLETMTGKEAAENISNFDDVFAEFAQWNWNQKPYRKYDDIPQNFIPSGESYAEFYVEDEGQEFRTMMANEWGMSYHKYEFSDDIEKIVFTFAEEGSTKHRRQALLKIRENWITEDWTNIKEKKFCRIRDSEDVKELVIIFSNTDPRTPVEALGYEIDTTGICEEWQGSTRITWDREETRSPLGGERKNQLQEVRVKNSVKLITRGEYICHDVLEYNPKTFNMEILSQQETINIYEYVKSERDIKNRFRTGKDWGEINEKGWELEETRITGSRNRNYSSQKNRPQKWIPNEYPPSFAETASFHTSKHIYDDALLIEEEKDRWAKKTTKKEGYTHWTGAKGTSLPPKKWSESKSDDVYPGKIHFSFEINIPKRERELKGVIEKEVRKGMFLYTVKIEYDYRRR